MVINFTNPGEIDIRLLTTMGVTVKENDSPIGYFGTGLKYAIAGVLRLGGEVTVYSGLKEYKFLTTPQTIRGKTFDLIRMDWENGSDVLGFTTQLGKNWKPWMLYREFWSNAVDEGGSGVPWDGPLSGCADTTSIYVDCEAITEAYALHSNYFLDSFDTISSNSQLEIHPKNENIALAYRSIRMDNTINGRESRYTYNFISSQNLTEDRTLSSIYIVIQNLVSALVTLQDRSVIHNILTAEAGLAETVFDYNRWDLQPSQEFLEVAFAVVGRKTGTNKTLRRLLERVNPEKLKQMEYSIPDSWDEIITHAPLSFKTSPSDPGIWDYVNKLEAALRASMKAEQYWRRAAAKLANKSLPDVCEPAPDSDEDIIPF